MSSCWRVLQKRYCEQRIPQLLVPSPVRPLRRQRCSFAAPVTRIRLPVVLADVPHRVALCRGQNRLGSTRWSSDAAAAAVVPEEGVVSVSEKRANKRKKDDKGETEIKYLYDSEGGPLRQLNRFYEKTYGICIPNEHFQRIVVKTQDKNNCSATYTCPVSNRTFAAGTLYSDPPILSEDDVVAYSRFKLAKRAAAGAFLDALQYSTTGLSEPRFCEEEPKSITMPQPTSETRQRFSPSWTPLSRLHFLLYGHNFGANDIAVLSVQSGDFQFSEFEDEDEEDDDAEVLPLPPVMWSAIITCPVSGTKFPSSVFRDRPNQPYWVDRDNIVYYAQKKIAIQSAAARFLDAMEYRKQNDEYDDDSDRLCVEHPSLLGDSLLPMGSATETEMANTSDELSEPVKDEPATDAEHPPETDTGRVLTTDAGDVDAGDVLTTDVGDVLTTDAGEVLTTDAGEELTTDAGIALTTDAGEGSLSTLDANESEETYIPGREGLLSDEDYIVAEAVEAKDEEKPVDWLLEAATKTLAEGNTFSSQNNHHQRGVMESALSFISSLRSELDGRESISIHRLTIGKDCPKLKLLRAKAILSAIGDSVSCLPQGHKACGKKAVANTLINLLWRLDEIKPDADTYALFIRCHDHRQIGESIESASRIISDMKAEAKIGGSPHRYPKPNTNTLNAFIQLNAQCGGTDGRFAEHLELLQPNRQSFLSILSSSIYDPLDQFDTTGFDPDFASDCIDRMNELFVETQDPSMKPDTQVYNAPLRWTGGQKLWLASRPYARSLQRDDYKEIYSHGVRREYHEDDLRIQEVENISSWVDAMKQKAQRGEPTHPNIETYEALMQAWLRTATRKGLDVAHKLFHELVEDGASEHGVNVRLETLHPLLASWYHSNEHDKWTKISEIISAWEDKIGSETKLDPRLMELKLLVSLSAQDEEKKTLEKVTETAVEVTRQALDFISHRIAVSNIFVLEKALMAWEEVAELDDGSLDTTTIVTQVESILTLFDENMRDATNSHFSTNDGNEQKLLKTMCSKAPIVYGSTVRLLSAISRHSLSPEEDYKISSLISRVVRCFGESRAMLKALKSEDSISTFDPDDDGFKYRLYRERVGSSGTPKHHELLSNVLAYLENKEVSQPCVADDLVAVFHSFGEFAKNSSSKIKTGALLHDKYPGLPTRLNALFIDDYVTRNGQQVDGRPPVAKEPQRGVVRRSKRRPDRKHRASANSAH